MKIVSKTEKKVFQPITLEITLETEQDLAFFLRVCNMPTKEINEHSLYGVPYVDTIKEDVPLLTYNTFKSIAQEYTDWYRKP